MDTEVKREKTHTRRGDSEKTEETTPDIQIPEELRTEITSLLQQLVVKSHELALELSTSDCEKINECGICSASREIIKIVKELNKTVKRLAKVTLTK